jgi:hypothetical protein
VLANNYEGTTMIERVFKFMINGKEYQSHDPIDLAALDRAARWCATGNIPDATSEVSNGVEVVDTEETQHMEAQTDAPAKKSKAKKPKPATTATKFSEWCKTQKVDGVKARRALRAAGYRAPYDPGDKEVQRIAKGA